ncbi:MAG TPA: DUF1385 domain-containing protein [Candidatus Dormibacteraeota bacterium]|jgi:uncharacterized protein YqhQ
MAQTESAPPIEGNPAPLPRLRPDLPATRGVEAGSPKPKPKAEQPFFYGGQAVIEGVMMRGKRHYAVAVRLPNTKEIVVDRGELKASIYVNPIWKLPFVRGLALIGEQLHLGMKSLIWSANMNAGGKDIVIGKREITGSVAVAGVFAAVIFIALPLLLAGVAVHRNNSFQFVVVEGLIRVGLVLGYLAAIALLPDVKRVFMYHGAEHKTINAFESGWALDVPSVRRASTLHPRCGTGFLLVVMVVSVVVFSIVAIFHPNWFWLIASRVLAIPLIAGAGFEAIRFMARHRTNPVIKILLLPVLGTQKFTTREPTDDMMEVAITAFNSAREGEEETAGAAA